jgi:hypothetical protein
MTTPILPIDVTPKKEMPKECIHGHDMSLYSAIRIDKRYNLVYWGCKKCESLGTTRRKFNLTQERIDEILANQNNTCAICFSPFEDSGRRRMSVDHDHKCCDGYYSCGQCVRGFLCMHCNAMIGLANDDIDLLISAISYLKGI